MGVVNPPILGRGGRRGPGMVLFERALVRPISLPYILFVYQHSFARNFRLQFSVGVANRKFWGRGGRRGSGMVPFERALMSFFSSIFTRFRDIASFVLQNVTFSLYPTSSLPKISPCSPGTRSIAFWPQRAKVLG